MAVEKVDIMAIGAHPDDVELSAAGTILSHIDQGAKVAIVDLTEGELGTRGTVETRYQEAADANKILGVSYRENLNLGDGFFDFSKENKIKIIEQIRRFQPKIVLVNAPRDRHVDHGRGSSLAKEACFLSGLRKIETTWKGENQEAWRPQSVYAYTQDYYIEPDIVVDITPYIDQKIEAIKAYKTQFWDPTSKEPKTPISGEDFFEFLKGRLAQYGRLIGVDYAEGYTVDRAPGVKNLLDLE
ncbi:MAG: bacillithiol biosynthesis deacetylase BshB1 [Crocinitomicaceae bacterium]|nr:bacillithiol biosynthesis deacetylase BshB1 [Crocinitomicaceae bacterium]